MAKDAYYFSHDSNARHDPKVMALIQDYGWAGYGRFWALVEIMRDQADYKLSLKSYVKKAIATELQMPVDELEKFLHDCVSEYELLTSDGQAIWSESLLRRMEHRNAVSQRRAEAGSRGGVAKAKQTSSKSVAIAKQNPSIATKSCSIKEKKEKEIKESKGNKNAEPAAEPDEFMLSSLWEEVAKEFLQAFPNQKQWGLTTTKVKLREAWAGLVKPGDVIARIWKLKNSGTSDCKPWDLFKEQEDKDKPVKSTLPTWKDYENANKSTVRQGSTPEPGS